MLRSRLNPNVLSHIRVGKGLFIISFMLFAALSHTASSVVRWMIIRLEHPFATPFWSVTPPPPQFGLACTEAARERRAGQDTSKREACVSAMRILGIHLDPSMRIK